MCRTSKFCLSASLNCSLNCTDPSDPRVAAACALNKGLSLIAPNSSICSSADILAGQWVKVYFPSDDDCEEGFDPSWWPGILKEKLCCSASQACNAPGAIPPSNKCFSTKFSPSAGYCAGKSSSLFVCATSQARANEKAAKAAQVWINPAC